MPFAITGTLAALNAASQSMDMTHSLLMKNERYRTLHWHEMKRARARVGDLLDRGLPENVRKDILAVLVYGMSEVVILMTNDREYSMPLHEYKRNDILLPLLCVVV